MLLYELVIYMFKNTLDNKRYYTLNYFYRTKFNSKIFKVSLNAGFSCPHKTAGKGCIFCSESGSGDFAGNVADDLITQFNTVKNQLHTKWPKAKYIGYFQANSNTYGNVEKLKNIYEPILNIENVVGLSIATRPDCFSKEIYDYLEELNNRTFLTIELGLQSIHNHTLKLINRGHDLECFIKCFNELKKRKIRVVVHIINGLPFESKTDMIETVKFLNDIKVDGIKIHMLHIIKNTELEKLYNETNFHILSKEEYIDIVVEQLEYLNENIVVERITGDPVKEDLIEPQWLIKKFCVLNDIDKKMVSKNTYQGIKAI